MILGVDIFGAAHAKILRAAAAGALALMLALAFSTQGFAQEPAQPVPAAESVAVDDGVAVDAASGEAVETAESVYTPLGPDDIKGQPTDGAYGFQEQYTDDGIYAQKMHDYLLMPVITAISIFVLFLLLFVVAKYRKSVNPVPSKTTHNTLIEVLWTLIPVIVLVVIAVPSITLLARQYETPPEDAVTIKATGYQWYWGYTYPDNGGFEVLSNMMEPDEARAAGLPAQLAVDNRMVVPANTPLRIQVIGNDVIHGFGIPSLWFKIDAVPGRLNERLLTINEPGIYYGQCMELCGTKHGYMPIAIEAIPRDQFDAWVLTQGGTSGEQGELEAEDAEPVADATGVGDEVVAAEAEASEIAEGSEPAPAV